MIIQYEMKQRVSIMIDEDIAIRIRNKQAETIGKLKKSVSFSGIINQCLENCLKNGKN